MKITKNWLEEKNACREGINFFISQKETESLIILKNLIEQKKLNWANWLIVRTMTYKQYVLYAIFSAEQVINIFEKKYPTDNRPRNAIKQAKKCILNADAAAYADAYAAAADAAAADAYAAAADAAAAADDAAAAAYAAAADDAAADAAAYTNATYTATVYAAAVYAAAYASIYAVYSAVYASVANATDAAAYASAADAAAADAAAYASADVYAYEKLQIKILMHGIDLLTQRQHEDTGMVRYRTFVLSAN